MSKFRNVCLESVRVLMNYHRMTVVVLAVCPLVSGLCKSPYELSQNDRCATESLPLSTAINVQAICPSSVACVWTLKESL